MMDNALLTPPEIFPLLVPKNASMTTYHGYLTTNNQQRQQQEQYEYPCTIEFKEDHAVIHFSPELQYLLTQEQQLFQFGQRNDDSHSGIRTLSSHHHRQQRSSITFAELLQQRLTSVMNQFNSLTTDFNDPVQQAKIHAAFFSEMKDVLDRVQQVVDHNQDEFSRFYRMPSNLYTNNEVSSYSSDGMTSATNMYKQIMTEIDEIGWDHVVDLNTDLTSISLMIKDEQNREHVIQVDIRKSGSSSKGGTDEQHVQYECHPNLPLQLVQNVKIPNTANVNKLQSIMDQLRKIISEIQDFFSVMEELDNQTWVLEPERPTYAHTMRRIAIGSHSSIQIEVNPMAPRAPPELRFLGADSVIGPLRESFHRRQGEWKMSKAVSLVQNLEQTLNIKFPGKAEQQTSDFSEECGICYSYKQENKIPDKVCDNPKCCMPFHSSCMVQWLRALQDAHQVFDTLSGKCPYCQEPISVKITSG